MKVSEMKKLLKKAGCRKVREGGNTEKEIRKQSGI